MRGKFKNLLMQGVTICGICGICGLLLLPLAMNISSGISLTKKHSIPEDVMYQNPAPPVVQSAYSESKSRENTPKMLPEDHIYQSVYNYNTFVIPEYKLIFFTFPKVACSEWKRMLMRMNGNPGWCSLTNPHDPKKHKMKTLLDHAPDVAAAMMTSPTWTKVAIFREPKERILSAFLDKAVRHPTYYVKRCCQNLPDKNLEKQCIDNKLKFDSFLHFVTKCPKECYDAHWEAQVAKIDFKWWPYIDVIGYQNNLVMDSQRILKMLHSDRDQVKGRSAWDRYGSTGWGAPGEECGNRTHSFMETNQSPDKMNTSNHLMEWYAAETEKLVEEKWAIEWQQKRVHFPEIKLF